LFGLTFCFWNIRIKASGIIHWIWIPWKAMVMQLQGYASLPMDEIWRQVFKHICSLKDICSFVYRYYHRDFINRRYIYVYSYHHQDFINRCEN
jgi:hypothetical protein